jgi:aminopeptidase YwaD
VTREIASFPSPQPSPAGRGGRCPSPLPSPAGRRLWLLLAAFAAPAALSGQERAIPFWPDAVPAAIRAEVDGNAALETVRELSRFHRVQGSPGYAAAAEHLRAKLVAAGLSDAKIERFPADGKTRYAHFVSYPGWNAVSATIEEVSPRPGLLASFPALPVALADYSQDSDVTAEIVDVGSGTDTKDYGERAIAGKMVLADGALPRVHRLACEERGAAGILSDFPNQTSAWSGDDRDLVRWGHLSPYQAANRFAFMLSKRQAEGLRARLAAGEKIVLRANVRAKIVPATYDVVSATIPGNDVSAGEVVLTAHLCHESAGANDNASGSAGIFEVARALRSAIARGTLPAPRRTIRFLWLPEIAGSQAWLVRHPEIVARLVAGIHMDMVGGLLSTTKSTFHISRTAETLPHVANVIARAWFEHVASTSLRYAERGGDPRRGLVWLPGSREPLVGDLRPLEMGSDHEVFQDSSFGVPMVYFHDSPDVTIHTNKDQPENLDATKLGRVAYMGAGIAWTLAAMPQEEAGALLALARGEAQAEIAMARARGGDGPDASLFTREAAARGARTLRTLADLWPVSLVALASPSALLEGERPRSSIDSRVPARNPDVRGPIDVYYYNRIAEVLGPDAPASTALTRREEGDVLAFEALNLTDGRRTVSEIRDVLAGRYKPVPVAEIGEYFDLLVRAKVVTYSPSPGGPPRRKQEN